MKNIVYFDFCALANLIIIIIAFYLRKNINNQQNFYFKLVLWCSLLSTIFDIMGTMEPIMYSLWEQNFSSYGYLIFHNLTPYLFLLYVMTMSGVRLKTLKKWKHWAISAPIAVSLLTIISTPFTKAAFYFDSNNLYYRGYYQNILYIIAFYYLVYGLFYIAFSREDISKKSRGALCSFYIMGGGSVFFQYFYPHLLVENFVLSLCIMMCFLTIQKPEELLDATTNVFSRITLTNILKINFKNKEKCILVIICLDNMEHYSQALGIENVQSIIKEVAEYLEVENGGAVYYLHNNTFGILVQDEDIRIADQAARKIVDRFHEPWIYKDMNMKLEARACIIRCPKDASSLDAVFAFMDEFVENKGNEDLITLAQNMDLQSKSRIRAVERAIRRALEEERLLVYYQPIYSVEKKRFSSAEALVRLKDEELGFIPPDEFISIAEKNGMILPIGTFVFESVCRFIEENDLQAWGLENIHVNLSVVQCMQDNLAIQLLSVLTSHNISVGYVRLEITETAAISFPQVLHKNMEYLIKKGVHFALDDYGTGYSNINSLANLPLDIIKLDKSIIWEADVNERAKIVLESSIAMIKKMNMGIVAEGVETREQRDELIRMGCDSLQGYYYSRPIEEKIFLDLLRENMSAVFFQ